MNYRYQPIHRWVDDVYILAISAGINLGWQFLRNLSAPGQSHCRKSGVIGSVYPCGRELDAPPRPCNWAAADSSGLAVIGCQPQRRGRTEYCGTTGKII
jgi:hypothetical protein